ncbi:MAG: thiamine phosphate synthase, partial [Myxococcota bacterium]|nr:thiamine phosphate synthase [Myxococcota bacterium]
VFAPISKRAPRACLGTSGLHALARAFDGPAIVFGGMNTHRPPGTRRAGATGLGTIGFVTLADDPGLAANALLRAWHTPALG